MPTTKRDQAVPSATTPPNIRQASNAVPSATANAVETAAIAACGPFASHQVSPSSNAADPCADTIRLASWRFVSKRERLPSTGHPQRSRPCT
ncbi:dna primase [Lasius niger]|uniref:Dna primase n=1 Tax=Lasius niger TaxID=67767 RepID=A0A0J7MTD3_LASNI|nr:dna primase [Lasius niger]